MMESEMAYTIGIGELEVEYIQGEGYIGLSAGYERHDNAPADGSETDYANQRWPAALVWMEFCRITGLYELFYNKYNGLMRNECDCVPIQKQHVEQVQAAYDHYRAQHPNAVLKSAGADENYVLARLEWLRYWMTWALENCKQPVISNR